jgi:SAM-dependent methyltransferase
MGRQEWAPTGVDMERSNAARAYDYLLGGSHNFAADREAARRAMEIMPDVVMQAKANRSFLHRSVRFLIDAGIDQFLDLGSGIPTVGNVHEIAQRIAPEARVVYVDIDPVAVAHSQQLLLGNPRAAAIRADLRDTRSVLTNPELTDVLDLGRPLGLLLVGVLHYVPDADDPYGVVSRLRWALARGSHLVVSHPTHENRPEWVKLAEVSRDSPSPVVPRTRVDIARFFNGFDLTDPGLVWAPAWHPTSPAEVGEHPELSSLLAGVGRLRG